LANPAFAAMFRGNTSKRRSVWVHPGAVADHHGNRWSLDSVARGGASPMTRSVDIPTFAQSASATS
jgi:hypothetical protein